MEKKALLCVSFGTSYPETLNKTIGAIERTLAEAFPDYEVRRAFTSGMIIRKIARLDGVRIDDVPGAMQKLAEEGFREVLVQPTHFMPGYEYDKAAAAVRAFGGKYDKLSLGKPLLWDNTDRKALAQILTELSDAKDTATVWMGHGTEHGANAVYTELQSLVPSNCVIGTVEAAPTLEDALTRVKGTGLHRVILRPMMMVAGDHATNDMAGDDHDSWKTVFAREGFDVTCIREGLGQVPAIRSMFVAHARQAEAV